MPATQASHQRRLRAFDPDGDLPERSAALWTLVEGHERAIARKFWERYREHSAGAQTFDDAKLEQLAERIVPYLRAKFLSLGDTRWIDTAKTYVADAMSAVGVQSCGSCGLSLSATARFCRRCGTRQAQPA